MSILFKECKRGPSGRFRNYNVYFDRSAKIEAKAKRFIEAGGWYEIDRREGTLLLAVIIVDGECDDVKVEMDKEVFTETMIDNLVNQSIKYLNRQQKGLTKDPPFIAGFREEV